MMNLLAIEALAAPPTVQTTSFEDGSLRSQITVVRRRPRGRARYWHPNGQLEMEGDLDGDQRVGEWKSWYATGQLAGVQHHRKGAYHGVVQQFQADGVLVRDEVWVDGRIHGPRFERLDFGNGPRSIWSVVDMGVLDGAYRVEEAGRVVESGVYRSGLKDGLWRSVDDGTAIEQTFVDGMLLRTCIDPDGRPKCEEHAPFRRLTTQCRAKEPTNSLSNDRIDVHRLDKKTFSQTQDCMVDPPIDWKKHVVWTINLYGEAGFITLKEVSQTKGRMTLSFERSYSCNGGSPPPLGWHQIGVVMPQFAGRPSTRLTDRRASCPKGLIP